VSPDEHDLMTAAAIARLAGVGRAAVSNWRRRYADFPRPASGSLSSPSFSRAAVEEWLKSTGKADQLATAGRTETGTQRIDVPEPAVTASTSGALLARVMVSLLPRSTTAARSGEQPVVLDPACGRGTLLLAVADRFGDRVRLVGQEIDEAAAASAAMNLRGHPDSAPYEIHTGDSLLDNRADPRSAAAVVCEPPTDPRWPSTELSTDPRWEFGTPTPRDGELAWVQHCYAQLRPRGVAVVAVSPRAGVQRSGRSVRAALVRSGALREVVALPAGLGSTPGDDKHLWVLQRGALPEGGTLRMVDLSAWAGMADVPHEVGAWQRLAADAGATVCRAVPRVGLLDGDTILLPSRQVAARVEASADDLARVTGRVEAIHARVGRGLPRFAAPPSPIRFAKVTLGELERVGACVIRPRDTTPRAGDVLLRTRGERPVVATGTEADSRGVAQVVEIDPTRLDPHFVAAFLRADVEAQPVASTLGVLSRDDLRRCRIPRLPLPEQRRYGEVLRRLHELQEALSSLAAVASNVIDQTIHGLTTGAVIADVTESETSQL
jgi:hypothetical protein